VDTSRLPPALVVGAHYDTFLQRALRRFFERATLESEAVPSPSSDGRLAIEPTDDPGALVVRWFGNRYVLRVPRSRPFTENEVRFARAIGLVLSARFHAILEPTVPLSRHIFRAPTRFYKTGVVFMAWINGHQDHFVMVGGQQSTRSLPHFAELFRLADAAGLIEKPDLAVQRMRTLLALHGVES